MGRKLVRYFYFVRSALVASTFEPRLRILPLEGLCRTVPLVGQQATG
jgi:hypothetical protein